MLLVQWEGTGPAHRAGLLSTQESSTARNWKWSEFLGRSVWSQEMNSMIFMGPFQLAIFYDSMKTGAQWEVCHQEGGRRVSSIVQNMVMSCFKSQCTTWHCLIKKKFLFLIKMLLWLVVAFYGYMVSILWSFLSIHIFFYNEKGNDSWN